MFHPKNGEKRWRFEELQDYMRQHQRKTKSRKAKLPEKDGPVDFYESTWIPFPGFERSDPTYRELRLMDTRRLGEGTFGIVFPGAISLPLLPCDEGELRYTPIAIKVSTQGTYHLEEAISALNINDLVTAGVTPNLTRLVDAFSIHPLNDATQRPPDDWLRFWHEFGDFVYERRAQYFSHYGKRFFSIKKDTATHLVTLPPNLVLSFAMYELAPNFLDPSVSVAYDPTSAMQLSRSTAVGLLPPSPPSNANSSSDSPPRQHRHDSGRHTTAKQKRITMLGYIWQICHGTSGLHAAGLLHCDIHGSNIVNHGNGVMRSSTCRLQTYAYDRDVSGVFGNVADGHRPTDHLQEPSALRYYGLPIDLGDHSGGGANTRRLTDCVALDASIPQIALIDYGSVTRCKFQRGTVARNILSSLGKSFFSPPGASGMLMKNATFSYPVIRGTNAATADNTRQPGITCVHGPVTVVFSRAPELLNPRVRTTEDPVIYSESSDVFSAVVAVVEHILGFHIFGPHILGGSQPTLGLTVIKRTGDRWSAPSNILARSVCEDHFWTTVDTEYAKKTQQKTTHGDNWLRTESPFYEKLESAFLKADNSRDRDLRRAFKVWFKIGDNMDFDIKIIINRFFALGPPTKGDLVGTLLGPIFESIGILDLQHGGWLRPTLVRVLNTHYGVSMPRVNDFVDLVMDGLSWDPTRRPSMDYFLNCSIFKDLYVNLTLPAHSDVKLQQLWSTVTITPATSEMRSNNELRRPSDVPILDKTVSSFVREKGPIPYSIVAMELARATDRIRFLGKNLYMSPAVHLASAHEYFPLHPATSSMLWLFNCEYGGLDPYDGTQILHCHLSQENADLHANYHVAVSSKWVAGRFKSKSTLTEYVRSLKSMPFNMPPPPWVLLQDCCYPTHVGQSSERTAKRARSSPRRDQVSEPKRQRTTE